MQQALSKFKHLVFTGEEISARTFANRVRSEADPDNQDDADALRELSSIGDGAFLSKKDGKVTMTFGEKKQKPTERY